VINCLAQMLAPLLGGMSAAARVGRFAYLGLGESARRAGDRARTGRTLRRGRSLDAPRYIDFARHGDEEYEHDANVSGGAPMVVEEVRRRGRSSTRWRMKD
jgi:hypothetical protein